MGENAFQSIAGNDVFCPECGSRNQSGDTFCAECGTKLVARTAKAVRTAQKEESVSDQAVRQLDLQDAFATGLASWDLEPPHVVVRRRNRRK